jgi:hypothetical protein
MSNRNTFKIVVFLVLLSLSLFSVVAQEDLTSYVVKGTRPVNARACPRLTCAVLQTFSPDDTILVLESVNGDTVSGSDQWFHVSQEGIDLYVHSTLVEPKPAVTDQTTPPDSSTSLDTSGWIEYQGTSFTLQIPSEYYDAREIMTNPDLQETMAQALGIKPKDFAESVRKLLESDNFDVFLIDPTTWTDLMITHEELGELRVTASAIQPILEMIVKSRDEELVTSEIITLDIGNAVCLHTRSKLAIPGTTIEFDNLLFGIPAESRLYYLEFKVTVKQFETSEPTLKAIATSFQLSNNSAADSEM